MGEHVIFLGQHFPTYCVGLSDVHLETIAVFFIDHVISRNLFIKRNFMKASSGGLHFYHHDSYSKVEESSISPLIAGIHRSISYQDTILNVRLYEVQ